MNEPIDHHFVSQVHLKNFFNLVEKKIYVYDKIIKNHYFKKTTKTLFSESQLNSRYIDGKIDHSSLEKDLNDFFEKDFPKNLKIINDLITHKELTEESEIALIYFAKYGIIGDMRTPRYKKHMDNSFRQAFNEIGANDQIKEMFQYSEKVKYNIVLDYSKLAEEILSSMAILLSKF